MKNATISSNDFFAKLSLTRSIPIKNKTPTTETKTFTKKENVKSLFDINLEGLNENVINIKKELRNHIVQKTNKILNNTKLFGGSRFSQPVSEVMEKGFETIENTVSKTIELSSSILNKLWNPLVKFGKFLGNVGKWLLNFVLGPFKMGWNFLNKFMNTLTPEIWGTITNISTSIFSTVHWLWSFGKKSLEFVWDGVSTIFKASYTVLSNAASKIYRGTKSVFMWWFKMLINTLISPSLWLFNIPIFLAITGAIFLALGTVSSILIDLSTPIFKSIFKLTENAFSWIWDGITWFWGWLSDSYEGSWLQSFVDTYVVNNIKGLLNLPFMRNVFYYINTAYKWIITDGVRLINKTWDVVNNIATFLKGDTGRSALASFINWTSNAQFAVLVPGWKQFTKFLQSKFGLLSGVSGGLNISDIKTQLTTLSKSRISNIIEYETIKLTKSGKSTDEALKEINDNLLPKLQSLIKDSGISTNEVDDIIKYKLQTSKNVLAAGGVGALSDYEKTIQDETILASEYEAVIENINNGIIDQSSPKFKEQLNKMFNTYHKHFEDVRKNRLEKKKLNTEQLIEKTIGTITHYKSELAKTSNLLSHEEFIKFFKEKQKAEESITFGFDPNNIPKSTVRNIGVFGQYLERINNRAKNNIGMTLFSAIGAEDLYTEHFKSESFADLQRENVDENFGAESDIVLQSRIRANRIKMPHQATGGIKIPDIPSIQPLNNAAISFVKEKIKNIRKPDDILEQSKQKNKEQSNITIIEEHTIHQDSYELYTMSHIARGLIAGG